MGNRVAGFFRAPAPADAALSGPVLPLLEQHRHFLEHCTAHGYDVAATFVDGPPEEHEPPAFDALLTFIRRDPLGLIVVLDHPAVLASDRLTALRRLYVLLAVGVQVEVAGDGNQDLLSALLGPVAEEGGPPLADRVREAMRRKAVKGEVLGRAPYGYRAGSRHRLEAVPEEAAAVRYIFRMYVHEGLGIRLIARRLNEEGYRTRRGGAWSMVTLRDILRNRVYLGTYARFGVRVPGSHQALVSNDDFRRAQERMASRRTSGGPRTVSAFLLSGLAICGACGGHMIGVSRRQSWKRRGDGGTSTAEYRYYQCGSRTNQSVCSYHTHRADDLDEQVRAAVVEALEVGPSQRDRATPPPYAALEAQQAAAAAELDRLVRRLVARPLDLERLHAQAMAAATRYEQASAAQATLEADGPSSHDEVRAGALEQLRDAWDSLTHEQRRGALEAVLSRVTVHDGRIDVELTE